MLFVEVSRLPRDALVEIELQAFQHRVLKHLRPQGRSDRTQEDDDWRVDTQSCVIPRAFCAVVACATRSQVAAASAVDVDVALLVSRLVAATTRALRAVHVPVAHVLHVRAFYKRGAMAEAAVARALQTQFGGPAVTIVGADVIQHDAATLLAFQVTAQDVDKLETELWLRKEM